MNDQVNAVLTAKDVKNIMARLRKIRTLSKGDLRILEHGRQIEITIDKGRRKVARQEKHNQNHTQ